MRILITESSSLLGSTLAEALASQHEIVTLNSGVDARDRDEAADVSKDCDAIVHLLPEVGPDADPLELLDIATRSTYNLLTTSAARRFILISSLLSFERYPAHWRVNESWAPRPSTAVED